MMTGKGMEETHIMIIVLYSMKGQHLSNITKSPRSNNIN